MGSLGFKIVLRLTKVCINDFFLVIFFFWGVILQKKFEKQTLGGKKKKFSMYNYAKILPTLVK
jgi:hypothetical protein